MSCNESIESNHVTQINREMEEISNSLLKEKVVMFSLTRR